MKNLTEGNIYKNFLLFAIPMILSSVITQASETINTIVAGTYLQEEGLAATGANAALTTFVSSIFWGYNMGFAVYIAKLFGAGRYAKLKSTMYYNLVLLSASVLAVSALLIVFRHPIYRMMNVDPEILTEADRYFTITTAGRVFAMLNSNYVCVLTAMGGSAFPFAVSLVTAALGVAGKYYAITAQDMGVTGIAVVTVMTSAMATAVCGIRFRANLKKLGCHKEKVTFCPGDMKEVFRYALPICAQQGLLYFIGLILSSVINSLGFAATAGYVVVQKIYDLTASVFTNASKTLSNYAAQGAGAGKYSQINKGLKVGALQALILTLPLVVVTVVFAEPLCKAFLPESGGNTALGYAILFARYYMPFILMYMFCNLFHSYFRGIAEMKPLLTATVTASVTRLLASIICKQFLDMEGIYVGWVISWGADLGLCLIFYLRRYRTPELLQKNLKKLNNVN